ncbi:hypothetical protein DH2020_008085 [Rehmannia glutinosa]|uniref:Transcription repressor n=1 Tax=Rehmannia glutinosa TaxID=99300 RepID=A0ABR0U0H4_REHGL
MVLCYILSIALSIINTSPGIQDMAKGPKLRLSFLNSIQICRPKDPSSLVKTPLPALTYYNSVDSESLDIKFPGFPDPPSSMPNHLSTKPNAGPSKITPLCYCSHSKSCTMHINAIRQRSVRTRRFKRFGSKDWKDGGIIITEPENEPREEKPVLMRLEDRKVNQSFVVVKRSVDPYKDFKKSMLEMIVEKQMFEPKELEQLLMSFLSLNSKLHHKDILKAFTEIWKEVFSGVSN